MSRWLKVVLWVVVIAAVIVLLFTVVFPRVERVLQDPTMGLGADAVALPAASAHEERSPR